MNFEADGLAVARAILQEHAVRILGLVDVPGHRRHELVGVDDVAADQHITPGDLVLERCRDVRIGEHVDRQFGEDRARRILGQPIFDRQSVIARRIGRLGHRIWEERRQLARLNRPAAHRAVQIGEEKHARRMDRAARHRILKLGKKLLLPVLHVGIVGDVRGEGEIDRRLHRAHRVDQLLVFGLRLIDQDIDADRLGAHLVDRGQCPGEDRPVERRTLGGRRQRIVVIGDHDDARVLVHARIGRQGAQVVKRPLRGDREGNLPAIPREKQGADQQQPRRRRPDPAERLRCLTQLCKRGTQRPARSVRLPSPTMAKPDQ